MQGAKWDWAIEPNTAAHPPAEIRNRAGDAKLCGLTAGGSFNNRAQIIYGT